MPETVSKPLNIPVYERPNFEEGVSQKTSRKIKESPMVPIGMAGFFTAVAYGIRHFRNRPKNVSASMYIMQFRVFAQSIAVGCMTAGIAYTALKDKFFHTDDGPVDDKHHHHGHHDKHHHGHHDKHHHGHHDKHHHQQVLEKHHHKNH